MTDQLRFDHELKIWPAYFEEVVTGRKTFEVREHDRPYQTGQTVLLQEWDVEHYAMLCQGAGVHPKPRVGERQDAEGTRARCKAMAYTGRSIGRRIGYMLKPGSMGLPERIVVFSVLPLTPSAPGA